MLATDKQINYLQQLADKVERMHKAHPGAVKCKTPYIDWHTDDEYGYYGAIMMYYTEGLDYGLQEKLSTVAYEYYNDK